MARAGWIGLALAALGLVTSACAPVGPRILTPDEARQSIASRVPADQLATVKIPYEIDDEIRQFARDATRGVRGQDAMADSLMRAMIDRTGLSIAYDPDANKTALQVFREGHADCLAYANLFVGMAREVGLHAVFLDVVTVRRSTREGELIVSSGHVTGGVLGSDHTTLIDFADNPQRKYRGHKAIDDLTAIAHFYNNEAYLRGFRQGDVETAVRLYQLVLEIDPSFYPAHNNLGVAFKLQGRVAEAVREYQLALAANPHFAEARANLGAALAADGRRDEALRQFKLAIRDNPLSGQLRQQQGILLLQARRYRDAEKSFRQALRCDPKYAPAAVSLGEALLAQGKNPEALSAFRRALQIDPTNADAERRLAELAPKQ